MVDAVVLKTILNGGVCGGRVVAVEEAECGVRKRHRGRVFFGSVASALSHADEHKRLGSSTETSRA